MNQNTQLLALDILDYFMDYGKISLHTQVGTKDFLTRLVNLLKTRDAPSVQVKILFLIEKWGQKFETQKDIIPNFDVYYTTLQKNGIQFPKDYQ